MGANYSFYVKTIETHARTFLPRNISAIAAVLKVAITIFVKNARACTLPIAKILSAKNARACVSMVHIK